MLIKEDLVDALSDSQWLASDDSESEAEEEKAGVVARKSLTFRVVEEQVVAWKRHDITGLQCFWDKYCSRGFAPSGHKYMDDVVGNEKVLVNQYGEDHDW